MKKILLALISIALLSSCNKEPIETNGSLTVYMVSQHNYTTVNVDGQVGTITAYYPAGVSECNKPNCANFTLEAGTYSLTASEDGLFGGNWSESVTISSGACQTLLLY